VKEDMMALAKPGAYVGAKDPGPADDPDPDPDPAPPPATALSPEAPGRANED
jgi:hypothetical protein